MSPQWRKWRNYLFNFTRAHYLERHNERHSRHCLDLVPGQLRAVCNDERHSARLIFNSPLGCSAPDAYGAAEPRRGQTDAG